MNVLDNPWFNRDVYRLTLHNVPHISFRKNLMDLDGCMKGLGGDTGSKILNTSKHCPMGREK